MSETAQPEIRLLTETDLPAAMRLKELANWNQTENDWRRLLQLEPQGCFAAWLDGQMVGTGTTTAYGRDLAWIGMILVDPAYRRRGIATKLMHAALAYLQQIEVATIKLDATPAGRPVYEALGFVSEGLVERWEAVAQPSTAKSGSLEPWAAELDATMLALDQQAFGADRAELLRLIAADKTARVVSVADANGQSAGYALTRGGTRAAYIGPLIATDQPSVLLLLDSLLQSLAGQKVFIDFHTGFGIDSTVLVERGFIKQRELIRMRAGADRLAGTSELVFAIAGPEIG